METWWNIVKHLQTLSASCSGSGGNSTGGSGAAKGFVESNGDGPGGAAWLREPLSHCLVATCCNVLLRPTLVDSCHLYLAQSSLPYKLALHHVVGTINRDLYGAWTEKLREKVSDQADPSSIGGGWPQPPVQGFHVVLKMTWTFQFFFTREPTNSTPHRPIRTKSDLIARLAVVNSWDTTQEQQTKAIAVIQSHTVL